jgi:hypothetical protein
MFKLFRLTIIIALVGILFTACTAKPVTVTPTVDNPYKPQSGDDTMMRGDAEIVTMAPAFTTSSPPEVFVSLAYRLPTPCYQLRVSISQPDSQNRILLEIYGMAPKDKPCTLMALATPLEASIDLGVFPVGQYTIWVNGQQSGEFSVK